MAADPYLIAGARAVARAQAADELAQSKGTQEVVNAGLTTLVNIMGKKKADSGDWTEQAHKILDKAGELPNAEYLALFDNLDGKYKEQYNQAVIDGDKKKQAMILKDIADMGRDYTDYKDFLHETSQDYLSGTLSNHMLHYDREGMHVMKLLEPGFANLVEKECEEGVPCDKEMGVMFPNFELIDEAENHIGILENQINNIYRSGDIDGEGNWYGDSDMIESLQAGAIPGLTEVEEYKGLNIPVYMPGGMLSKGLDFISDMAGIIGTGMMNGIPVNIHKDGKISAQSPEDDQYFDYSKMELGNEPRTTQRRRVATETADATDVDEEEEFTGIKGLLARKGKPTTTSSALDALMRERVNTLYGRNIFA